MTEVANRKHFYAQTFLEQSPVKMYFNLQLQKLLFVTVSVKCLCFLSINVFFFKQSEIQKKLLYKSLWTTVLSYILPLVELREMLGAVGDCPAGPPEGAD